MCELIELPLYKNFGKPKNPHKPYQLGSYKYEAERSKSNMDLKSKVSTILDRNDIKDGDTFFCSRSVNAPVKRRYIYEDGKIKSVSGLQIKSATVKNLLNYYIIRKE